ncbi:MAG: cyclic nucleotide-binding domain-containing protein [Armatimonadetes bacterium]|nr:cyclic nucleotide-binding domain-containing protein [Armatimonadota bacterium]
MDLLGALRASYLTEGLSDEDVNALTGIAEFLTFQDLQEIVRSNETSFDLYVVQEGTVEVALESGDPVARLKPGAIVGEFAFFENGHRSATVMSAGQSVLIHLDGEKLLDYMSTRPMAGMTIYRNLGKTLCQRLRSANIQIERLVSSL